MTVATDLQDLVADVSAAIAGRKTFGRTELEVLRRRLSAAATELRDDQRAGAVSRMVLADLCGGVERGVADLSALVRRAREQMPVMQ